jgi:hypothetical protein
MPPFDYTQPMTFLNAFEQFSVALHGVMVALRDEVNFGEERDEAILNAATLLCSLLEDTQSEANVLMEKLERRVLSD